MTDHEGPSARRDGMQRVPAPILNARIESVALSPQAKARNAGAFVKIERQADAIAEYAAILACNARLAAARDTKASFNVLAWLMRELRATVEGVEEAG